jgi:hypothetical protein
MPTDTEAVRTAVARLIVAGDFQELINLYSGGDLAAAPERVDALYPGAELSADDRQALSDVSAALPDSLLPPMDSRATASAEMVELTARFALERGKSALAVRALREAEALDKVHRAHVTRALETLASGDMARAAFELSLAARLGWARTSPEARREFVIGLGIHPGELAHSLGAESSRGRISGGRALPDFPAWQAYGPLFHARCHVDPCISDLPLDASIPLAIRLLLHSNELAEQAMSGAKNGLELLKALTHELDPDFPAFAERYTTALTRYRALHDEGLVHDNRLAAQPAPTTDAPPADAAPDAESEADPDDESDDTPEDEEPKPDPAEAESSDKTEAAREGLQAVQAALLGRPEKEWRNALTELAATHPLSVFAVCTARGGALGTYAIPAGQRATEFLAAVNGP